MRSDNAATVHVCAYNINYIIIMIILYIYIISIVSRCQHDQHLPRPRRSPHMGVRKHTHTPTHPPTHTHTPRRAHGNSFKWGNSALQKKGPRGPGVNSQTYSVNSQTCLPWCKPPLRKEAHFSGAAAHFSGAARQPTGSRKNGLTDKRAHAKTGPAGP